MERTNECPTCGAVLAPGVLECPECGEKLKPIELEEEEEQPEEMLEEETLSETGQPGRMIFFIGILLILIGGPGLALGSYLHDLLKINIGGDNWEYFGPRNWLMAGIGFIVLIIGVIFLVISLMKKKVPEEEEEEEEPTEEEPLEL